MKFNATQTANWLKEQDHFLILTHRRPDGDTLGTAAGFCALLRKMGKTAYLFENPETTPRYLPYANIYWAPENFVHKTLITVDTADSAILSEGSGAVAQKIDLCIDHHASNTGYAQFTYLDTTAAACGELIVDLAVALQVDLDPEIATPLYVALTTDTGCFQYANTTGKTLFLASQLVFAGAKHVEINKSLFRTKSRGRIALDGVLFSNLQFFFDGKMAACTITNALLEECKVVEDDLDDIATVPNLVEGVTIGAVVRELSPGFSKVSLRTAPNSINASLVCQGFGGGGHPMAAGCTIAGTPQEALEKLVAAIEGQMS